MNEIQCVCMTVDVESVVMEFAIAMLNREV